MDMKTSPLASLQDATLLQNQRADRRALGRRQQPLRSRRSGHRAQARRRGQPRCRRDRARDQRRQHGLAGLARQDGQGAPRHPDEVVRAAEPTRRRPGAHHDRRAGQAAGRGARRGDLRRQLHRVVRRGRQARLRRDDPDHRHEQAHGRHQAADRRLRGDHAVELSDRDDHAQGRAGAGRRLPGGDQAGRSRRRCRRWPGRTRAARRHAGRRAQRGDRRRDTIDRGRQGAVRVATSCATCRSPAPPRSAAS